MTEASSCIQTTMEQVFVPDNMVGLIIGRGGEQISRLQAESKCKIQMAPDSQGLPHRWWFLNLLIPETLLIVTIQVQVQVSPSRVQV